MFLPLAFTLIALVVLPERVPMHYDMAGKIDRWGSKYENLIIPAVVVLAGLLYTAMARGFREKKGDARERVLLTAFCGVMAVFNILTVCLLIQAYTAAAGSGGLTFDLTRILFAVTGIVFIAVGNLLPKLRRNQWVGVRTVWSMESDGNWRRSQMIGGVVFILAGATLIVGNIFFFREENSLFFSLLVLLLTLPVFLGVAVLARRKKGAV